MALCRGIQRGVLTERVIGHGITLERVPEMWCNIHDDFYDAREMLEDFAEANRHFQNVEEEPTATTSHFYKMLDNATEPLYPNCERFTTLSFVNKLLQFRHKHGVSNKGFDDLLEIIGSTLPENHKLPLRYYDVKKMISGLSMGYEKIDACVNDCMLFYKEDSNKTCCDICTETRYKAQKDPKKSLIPRKILRYFPIAKRLQRLFMSEKTAKCMTWHHDRVAVEGHLSHPTDGDEWKQFNHRFPRFAKETRNVRIGLATDGFDLFRDAHAREYTVWPVIAVAGEVIEQVMQNCKKVIVEGNQSEMDPVEQNRILLEMDFGREDDDRNLVQYPLYG